MEAYHLALFGASYCPREPVAPLGRDKRKRYDREEPEDSKCVPVGGDVFLYPVPDSPAKNTRQSKISTTGNPLSAIQEVEAPAPQPRNPSKASMLKRTRSASRRALGSSKNVLAGATSSLTSLFSAPKPTASSSADDLPKPQSKTVLAGATTSLKNLLSPLKPLVSSSAEDDNPRPQYKKVKRTARTAGAE